MSPWNSWRRGIRPVDITWMPEEVELAPDWVREEVLGASQELQEWLADHVVLPATDQPPRPRPGRRGRRPKRQS